LYAVIHFFFPPFAKIQFFFNIYMQFIFIHFLPCLIFYKIEIVRSILGGTCTLIGTSTNLVVVGLLQARYPGEDVANIGLFDLGKYGVPIAFAGMIYILLFSNLLMPGGSKFIGKSGSGGGNDVVLPADLDNSILLGARLTKWSNAVNRTVKRSGLRDTAGLYLVNVHRAATGNVHRAVGQDFVMNVGDILYFTGLVEEFGKFCQENSLEGGSMINGDMVQWGFLLSLLTMLYSSCTYYIKSYYK
jgi:hypothetical protein